MTGVEETSMTEEIRKGIHRIEVPLPGSPLKMLSAYCILGRDRHLLIDTGFNRPECRDALLGALRELGVRRGDLDVFLTHLHADHSGLAAELTDGTDAKIMCSAGDGAGINAFIQVEDHKKRLGARMLPHGFTRAQLDELCDQHPAIRFTTSHALEITAVKDGDELRYGGYTLRVVGVPGHTPDQVTLYEPEHRLYFSGDHILGSITPNITRWPGVADSLGDYLRSLDKVREFDIAQTLPAHRALIPDTRARIDKLREHHAKRLDEVRHILADGPANAYAVASRMTWSLRAASWEDFPVPQKWFATGEALSHLDRLAALGEVREEEHDGKSTFCRV